MVCIWFIYILISLRSELPGPFLLSGVSSTGWGDEYTGNQHTGLYQKVSDLWWRLWDGSLKENKFSTGSGD